MKFSADSIREKLGDLGEEPRHEIRAWGDIELGELREAAVLIPLVEMPNGEFDVLLTKRSEALRQHSGEVSFPGGRRDPEDDTLVTTALREAREEVGLFEADVRVHGAFYSMPTISNYALTAYVGEVRGPYEFVPNPAEIDVLIQAPLRELADRAIYDVTQREWNGHVFDMHSFLYDGHTIWGATGLMLDAFIRFLKLR